MKSVFSTTVYSVTSDQAKKPCGTKSDSYTRTYIDDIFTQRLIKKFFSVSNILFTSLMANVQSNLNGYDGIKITSEWNVHIRIARINLILIILILGL